MAKIFKFKPEEVDKIDFDLVLGMLSMESHTRKKEADSLKQKK